ncbi:MAG: hypothetical protein HKN87_19845 [Saprospiraceae bacterium]|nr:hypothetical protein [Saprospiraceae bacterium]
MQVNASYQTLRRLLGQLGIMLPLILWITNGFTIESSISHFYYTEAGTLFTGILIAFGLFLFTYRGYRKNKIPTKKEWIDDNNLTNVGGVLAIMTGLIPTSFGHDFQEACVHPLCHNNSIFGTVHLLCAAGFLGIMGAMSIFKFTMGSRVGQEWKHGLYIAAGAIVWISIIFMAIYIYLRNHDKMLFANGVFWGETVALMAFGISWLVKGKPSQMWIFTQFSTTKKSLDHAG